MFGRGVVQISGYLDLVLASLLNRTRRMLQFMNGLASLAGPSDLAGTIIGS